MKPFAAKAFISCHVVNAMGATLLQCDSRLVNFWLDPVEEFQGEFRFKTPWLKPGNYRVDMFICSAGILDRFEQACQIAVTDLAPYASAGTAEGTAHCAVLADFSYSPSTNLSLE